MYYKLLRVTIPSLNRMFDLGIYYFVQFNRCLLTNSQTTLSAVAKLVGGAIVGLALPKSETPNKERYLYVIPVKFFTYSVRNILVKVLPFTERVCS